MDDSRALARLAVVVLCSASALAAQRATAQAPSRSGPIAEIVVTAQKREQNLQDVPIVVTAVPGELLRDTGVKDIKDLTILTPGLIVTSTSNESVTTARIRGVGTVGDNAGLESSVGVVIDGVYRPRNGVGFGDLGELSRIEVLKGPQGTLFGKNTSAGVINILTQAPQFEFGVNGELTGGNFGALEAASSITGPIVADKVAARLYAARRKRDGFYDVSTGAGPRSVSEDSDRDFYTARGQLLFQSGESLSLRLIGDYSKRKEICCAATQINVGASAPIINALSPDAGVANPAEPFAREAFLNRSTPQDIEDYGVSAQLDWNIGALDGATLTSISAWRSWDLVSGIDADYSTADIWYRPDDGRFGNQFDQLSQEVRLAGQSGRLNWLMGAFYAREQLDSNLSILYGSAFEPYYSLLFSQGASPALISGLSGRAMGTSYPLDAGTADRFEQDSDSYAFFTNNSLAFTERLEGTIGLRYTNEEKDLDSTYANVGGGAAGCAALRARRIAVNNVLGAAPPGTIDRFYSLGCGAYADPAFDGFSSRQKIDESEWSGTAKLALRFTEDFMTYVSYARGYKAGGFNLDRERVVDPALGAADPDSLADDNTSFGSETVDSYELGAKTSWLNRSLLLNAAAFYQKFEDFQLNTFTGISFIVTSVPEVVSKGVDMDLVWVAPGDALTMQGGVTYADTSYGDFVPTAGVPARLPNSQMSFAPRWTGCLAATYTRPIGANLHWRMNVGAKTTSHYNTGSDLSPAKEQGGFTWLNARVGLGSASDRWTLEAWGQNLTDKDYYQVIIDAPLQPDTYDGFLGAPRTYGLTLRMQF